MFLRDNFLAALFSFLSWLLPMLFTLCPRTFLCSQPLTFLQSPVSVYVISSLSFLADFFVLVEYIILRLITMKRWCNASGKVKTASTPFSGPACSSRASFPGLLPAADAAAAPEPPSPHPGDSLPLAGLHQGFVFRPPCLPRICSCSHFGGDVLQWFSELGCLGGKIFRDPV